jgi:hypothetical protein
MSACEHCEPMAIPMLPTCPRCGAAYASDVETPLVRNGSLCCEQCIADDMEREDRRAEWAAEEQPYPSRS